MVVALGERAGYTALARRRPKGCAGAASICPRRSNVRAQALFPAIPRRRCIDEVRARPVLGMDAVPREAQPFVSAAGLLMYFKEAEVRDLLVRIAARLSRRRGLLRHDHAPRLFAGRCAALKVTKRYTAPAMPWGIHPSTIFPPISRRHPRRRSGLGAEPTPTRSRGGQRLYKLLSRLPPIRRRFAGGLVYLRMTPRVGRLVGYC